MKNQSSIQNFLAMFNKLGFIFIFLSGLSGLNWLNSQVATFTYTGAAQTWTVPGGVTSISIETWGAQGSNSADRLPSNGIGGLGGYAKGSLSVVPGQVINIFVGGAGNTAGVGGYNGGGDGGLSVAGSGCSGGKAGGGGGASDVRIAGIALANRVIVGGGGGGAGRDYCNGSCQPCGCGGGGGGAGGLTGTNGIAGLDCGFGFGGAGINFGKGGSQVAGGLGGPTDPAGPLGNPGLGGSSGIGGVGADGNFDVAGGGGGGGYFGGGGGGGAGNGSGVAGGGAGGGSSYIGGVTGGSTTTGVQSGNGLVTITYNCPCLGTGSKNGSFEYNCYASGSVNFTAAFDSWTSNDQFEIWGSGANGIPSYHLSNFLELNSNFASTIYQDITTCGDTYYWQVAHRGRAGTETAVIEAGPTGGPFTTLATMTDGTGAWVLYSGSYTVPMGQTVTRVRLRAVSPGGSVGNLVDAFGFAVTAACLNVDSDGDGYSVAYGDCNDNNPAIHPCALFALTCPSNMVVTAAANQCTANVCYSSPVVSSCSPAAPVTPAGYTFKTTFGNSYYYQANALSNYATAESNAIAAGGHLAVITSAAENAAVAASGAGFAWMGGNDLVTNGTWKWATCETFSYSNFCPGEPNGGTFENHLEMEAGGCWNDLVLTANRYGLLEIEGAKVNQTGGLAKNAVFPVGVTINTFQATDAGGNTTTCSFTVSVSASSCKVPVQVYHIDTTATTAKVKWKAPTGVNCTTGYQLRIRRELSPGVWGAWSSWVSPTGILEHQFTGLLASSFYNYQIHTSCGPNKNSPDINDWFFTLAGGGTLTNGGPISDLQDRIANEGNNSIQELPANLLLVPNPAKDFTTVLIEGFSTGEKTVTLFDLYGKLIFNVKAGTQDNLLELDLAKLNVHTGVYMVRVSDGQKQKTTQLMIER